MNISKYILKIILVFICFNFITACSEISADYDYNLETDFSIFSKYRLGNSVRSNHSVNSYPIIRKRIKSAINRELNKKGFTISHDDAEFEVRFYTDFNRKKDFLGLKSKKLWKGLWEADAEIIKHKEGTLVIDLIDINSSEVIWRGWSTGVIGNLDDINNKIDKAVVLLFQDFPPRQD